MLQICLLFSEILWVRLSCRSLHKICTKSGIDKSLTPFEICTKSGIDNLLIRFEIGIGTFGTAIRVLPAALRQRASVTPVLVLCLVFFNKKSLTKRK